MKPFEKLLRIMLLLSALMSISTLFYSFEVNKYASCVGDYVFSFGKYMNVFYPEIWFWHVLKTIFGVTFLTLFIISITICIMDELVINYEKKKIEGATYEQ